MECVNCGRENPKRALVCYWCGRDPNTGQQPYSALAEPTEAELSSPEVALEGAIPPSIEVSPTMEVPSAQEGGLLDLEFPELTMPEAPSIEIAPPPDVSKISDFKPKRQRAVHRPVVRYAPPPPRTTRPMLPNVTRLLIFVGGLALLFLFGVTLVGMVGTAAFGSICVLSGLFGLVLFFWLGLLLARVGRHVVGMTGAAYERLEVLGQALRESIPGRVIETPFNLPQELEVADLPVSFSQLRYLAGQVSKGISNQDVDLITSAIAELVARDDVVLAKRSYPVRTEGALQSSAGQEVENAVLTQRRAYVGPGELEFRLMEILRTDRPITVEELVRALVADRDQARRVVDLVARAIQEEPPNLDALDSPDQALAEWERYRQAIRENDPELYDLIETEVRRGLRKAAQRQAPSSLLDMIKSPSKQ